ESSKISIIPPSRFRYLSEIAETNRNYNTRVEEQSQIAQKLFGIRKTLEVLADYPEDQHSGPALERLYLQLNEQLDPENRNILANWEAKKQAYRDEYYRFSVRGKEIKVKTHHLSLSNLPIPKIALPSFEARGAVLECSLRRTFPGEFPDTAGICPFKRGGEDRTRMFAGEGGPERTSKRFHYVSSGLPAARLSTAFDSVTLSGQDPEERPDIFGKIGNAGVSVPSLDDAKKLYSGFDLSAPTTSVSMI